MRVCLCLRGRNCSVGAERKKEKRKRHANVLFNGAECKYPVIRDLVKELGWTWVDEGSKHADNCHLYWIDVANIQERFAKIQRWQRVNHFPGMPHIARKTRMAQNLDKMRRTFPVSLSGMAHRVDFPSRASSRVPGCWRCGAEIA